MRAESIPMPKKFSAGFAGVKGDNNTPVEYGKICRNIKLQDGGIQNIKGFAEVYAGTQGANCYGVYGDSYTGRLFRNYDGKWEEVNITAGTITDYSGLLTLPKSKCRFISYQNYIIILTGSTKPYIFDTSTNTLSEGTTTIDDSVYPFLGAQYMYYTFLAYKNHLYISEPIVVGSENKAISWKTTTAGTQQIAYKTNITALVPTLERLWIITDEFIEYIDPNTVQMVGDVATITPVRYAESQVIVNQECMVPVGSKLFFWTRGNKIRSIGYKQGVAQLQVSDLSDVPLTGIDNYIQTICDDDQSEMAGYFDQTNNEIRWFVKRRGASHNDLGISYSLSAKGFTDCLGKPFGSITMIGEKVYASDAYKTNKIYQDNTGTTFDGKEIIAVYESHPIKLGQPNMDKFRRGGEWAGKVNNQTNIMLEAFVDGKAVMAPKFIFQSQYNVSDDGIAGSPIAGQPIAGDINAYNQILNVLNYVATAATIRAKGKQFSFRLTFSGWDQDWVMDYFAPFVINLGKYKLSDKT